MKRLILALSLAGVFAFVGSVQAALPASANCNNAGAGLDSDWTGITQNLLAYDGLGACAGFAEAYQVALWATDAFGDDQYTEIVLGTVGSGQFAAPAVRLADGAGDDNSRGYYLFCGNASAPCNVQECSDAAPSSCAVIGEYSESGTTADTMKIAIAGARFYVYKNGSEMTCDAGSGCAGGVLTDNTFSSGSGGMAVYGSGTIDSWAGDNFEAPQGGGGGSCGLLLLGVSVPCA